MDEKRFYVAIILVLASASVFGIVIFSGGFTGLIVGSTNVTTVNSAPVWSTIPNQSWPHNTQISINLSNYTADAENYTLLYSSTAVRNISLSFSGANVTLIPDPDFSGNRTVIFIAYDYVNTVYSGVVYLDVNSTTVSGGTNETIVYVNVGSGGGGSSGGTTYVSVLGNETKTRYLTPSVECDERDIYLKDYFERDVANIENVKQCYKIYLNDASFIYVNLINLGENLVVVDFENEMGVVNSLALNLNEVNYLDVDGDGLDEYSVVLKGFSSGKAKLEFNSIEKVSFGLISGSLFSKYWWVVGLLVVLFLGLLIYFLAT
jgi:hypothetical protein